MEKEGERSGRHVYIDESIHAASGFICTAMVCAESSLDGKVAEVLTLCGLKPGVDEFKSSALMHGDKVSQSLRDGLKHMLYGNCKVALLFCHLSERAALASRALMLLEKILERDAKVGNVFVHMDEGIGKAIVPTSLDAVSLHMGCNSKEVLGIQLADLCAHSASSAVKNRVLPTPKLVRAGENSGYPPDLLVHLDFELWASLRYSLASHELAPAPNGYPENLSIRVFKPFGLDVSDQCPEAIQRSIGHLFGVIYVGCIH